MLRGALLAAGLFAASAATATPPAGGALTHPEHDRAASTRTAPRLDAQRLVMNPPSGGCFTAAEPQA